MVPRNNDFGNSILEGTGEKKDSKGRLCEHQSEYVHVWIFSKMLLFRWPITYIKSVRNCSGSVQNPVPAIFSIGCFISTSSQILCSYLRSSHVFDGFRLPLLWKSRRRVVSEVSGRAKSCLSPFSDVEPLGIATKTVASSLEPLCTPKWRI